MTEPTGGELRRCPDCDSFILASAILNHRCERPSRTPMTRIEQIRQREQVVGWGTFGELHADVTALLSAWDTRDAALRTLVEQLRAEADGVEAMGYSQQADRLRDCAGRIDAILKETT